MPIAARARKPADRERAPEGQPPVGAIGISPERLRFHDDRSGTFLYEGDCLALLDEVIATRPSGLFDAVFADPPYFLSNGGITCSSGRMVKVDKGGWDKSRGVEENHAFSLEWLRRCQQVLKPNGTIWISGTQHVIFSAGFALQQLGFKILNSITWEKPNPPPNLSCRYFTHSTETLLWAARDAKSRHVFHYAKMRAMNGGRQMKSVWRFTAPAAAEKRHGRHPTQKPLELLERCLLASTNPGDLILDPFVGSGTTAAACARLDRRCVGMDRDPGFLQTAARRIVDELDARGLRFPEA